MHHYIIILTVIFWSLYSYCQAPNPSTTSIDHTHVLQEIKKQSQNPDWLAFYQYKKNLIGKYKSEIKSQQFFVSPVGQNNPEDEMLQLHKQLVQPNKKLSTLNLDATCAYPARKKLLQKLLNFSYPVQDCPDIKNWLQKINANRVSLVFAGPYADNPASILGHTFLRFYNEDSNSTAAKLLTYSVGFTAVPDPNDNKLIYTVKGVTGEYPGYYDIEPHYIKVGLYNNSESRDLWEYSLNLDQEQVKYLLEYIWELTFNAEFKYYFFDQNCSYRLIVALGIATQNNDLAESLPIVVAPSETIHQLKKYKLITSPATFKASTYRKLKLKEKLIPKDQFEIYEDSKSKIEALDHLSDATAYDALLDYWLIENYKNKVQLKPEQKEIYEKTLVKTSKISEVSLFNKTDLQIQNELNLKSPTDGHLGSWFKTGWQHQEGQNYLALSYRMGIHPEWQALEGFDGVSEAEYLGFDLITNQLSKFNYWNLQFLAAKNKESLMAWYFNIGFNNSKNLSPDNNGQFYLIGGWGLNLATENKKAKWTSYLTVENDNQINPSPISKTCPGLKSEIIYKIKQLTLTASWQKQYTTTTTTNEQSNLEAYYQLSLNQVISMHQQKNLTQVYFNFFY